MSAIASQITSLTIVYSTVYSDADQRKHQNSVSLAFVRGIHRGPLNSPHKWPVTRKLFPFDGVIMNTVRSKVNGLHFVAVNFTCIFLSENVDISIQIPLNHSSKTKLLLAISQHWSKQWFDAFRKRAVSHYSDVIMSAMASQITGISVVQLTVCSGADQRKHQSSASLAFVRWIYRWPVDSPHKGPVRREMFPFDDIDMRTNVIRDPRRHMASRCVYFK